MKSKLLSTLFALSVTGVGSFTFAAKSTQKADVPLTQVPQVVIDAAAKAVRGISLTEAKLRSKKSGVVFKLEGVAAGKEYDLKVDATGRVLTVERDDVRATARSNREWPSGAQPDPVAAAMSPAQQIGTLEHPPIRESSGIVASRRHPGVFWTHNDKGNAPVLYAVTAQGKLLAEYPIDAPADDWEDLATDDSGNLYIGNIGNNKGKRPHLEVYRIAEPKPANANRTATVDKTWYLQYPDEPLNCESLFIRGEYAYVISKLFNGQPAGIYRFPLNGPAKVTLENVGQVPVRAPVSAADLSPDGQRLAILSPAGVHLFDLNGDPTPAPQTPTKVIPVPLGKLEGLCFTPDGILLTAEERPIYRIPQ